MEFACGGCVAGKLLFSLSAFHALRLRSQIQALGSQIMKEPELIAPQNERNDQGSSFKEMIRASKEDYEQLPPYMKSLASWEERLLKRAQAENEGKTVEAKKPIVVKYGLNHVTYLIEQNKAQLVVIAHDVDPIELVVWLPALCRKMEVPCCIVKGKAGLGTIVHKKTASVLCLTTVKNEDKLEFSKILEAIKANFNNKFDKVRKKWGGGIMGSKSQAKTKAREKLLAKRMIYLMLNPSVVRVDREKLMSIVHATTLDAAAARSGAGAWAGMAAQLGGSMGRCGLERRVGKATGACRGGSVPAGGERAAPQQAPSRDRALA
ncbi:hypothetical protein C2845_PM10G07810 [Panicum miliaceum]|uniref:60S ribosomal protein L7a n=1 Tax=Panicum miliaceum TaxID=4540 RepID=A0A3L6PFG3_PANMI|nr:hypothetical protein C2845_PM10G07810 [Panicum miliaceum]